MATVLGIEKLLKRSIRGLSGGESQRVALGRALSFQPSVLLLDEPFSALDESTRDEMHSLIRNVTQSSDITTLHVTHSRQEADALANRRFVLHEGVVTEQTPATSTDSHDRSTAVAATQADSQTEHSSSQGNSKS